jgi:hypothetical protein
MSKLIETAQDAWENVEFIDAIYTSMVAETVKPEILNVLTLKQKQDVLTALGFEVIVANQEQLMLSWMGVTFIFDYADDKIGMSIQVDESKLPNVKKST